MVNRGAMSPDLTIRRETSISSSTSSVRALTAAAREVLAPAVSRSTTMTSAPRCSSDAASVSPVGPAPTTRTSVSIMVILQLESQRLLALPIVRLSATYVNSCWPTIVDMRRTSQDTKAAILAAARERFGTAGFQAATIRGIAADAGIDPSMVMRYFGSKDKLFAAAAEFDLRFPDFATMDRTQVGRSLVRHFLERWEGDEALVVLLRSSATNEEAAQRMHEIFGTQIQPLAASFVSAEQSRARAGLIATQILGMALCRFVLRLPPVVEMTRDEIIDSLGPTIQRYLGLPDA